jgi:hypothetical protein
VQCPIRRLCLSGCFDSTQSLNEFHLGRARSVFSGLILTLCEIGIGVSKWEDEEDRKYDDDHRRRFQTYIRVRAVGTLQSRLNCIGITVLLTLSVGLAALNRPLTN